MKNKIRVRASEHRPQRRRADAPPVPAGSPGRCPSPAVRASPPARSRRPAGLGRASPGLLVPVLRCGVQGHVCAYVGRYCSTDSRRRQTSGPQAAGCPPALGSPRRGHPSAQNLPGPTPAFGLRGNLTGFVKRARFSHGRCGRRTQ